MTTENSVENNIASSDLTSETVQKAIASLAKRVASLEKDAPAIGASGDGSDFRPTLAATLGDLKALRTTLLTCFSDVDEKINELDAVKAENAKLKYQIKHLIRSLEVEERKTSS